MSTDERRSSIDDLSHDAERHGMDELSAHLDRGWDLWAHHDYGAAEVAAQHALALDPRSAEALTLLGAICGQRGEVATALSFLEKAHAFDPDYIYPLLYQAELCLGPLGDPEEAIRLCEKALSVAEEEEEYFDALLLKADAELLVEDEEAARETLAELPPTDYPEPTFHLRAGRCWLDLGELDAAERELDRAFARDPELTDALHLLGQIYAERGDEQRAVATYLDVRERDLKAAPFQWSLSRERFEELTEQQLQQLPARIIALLENVPILAGDYPDRELVAQGHDPRMLGFFAGVPFPEKSSVGGPPSLDHVLLFQRNIERICSSPEEVAEEIRVTLLHETGHFFGLSDQELEELGLG